MPKNVFFLIGLLTVTATSAQTATDSTALFKAGFLNHEWQPYTISQTTYSIEGSDTLSMDRLQIKADVYVKDSTRENYTLLWSFHDFSINTANLKLKQLVDLATPVSLTCQVSPVGRLQDFIDWSALTTCLDEAFKQLLPQFAGRADEVSKAQVASMYDFRQSLEGVFARSVTLFYQLYGNGYTLNEVVEVPTNLAVSSLPEPIPGIVRKKLLAIDQTNQLAVITTVSIPDSAAFNQAVAKFDLTGKRQAIPSISGSVVTDMNSGWTIYTFEQIETTNGNRKTGELLELKYAKLNLSKNDVYEYND
jgi:hypothetical protein